MTLGVVVEARGLKDAEATLVLEQRVNEGDWEPVGNAAGRAGRGRDPQADDVPDHPQGVGQYEFRARVEDAGPELTQEDNVATAAVKVVRQQIRVLLIAGAPSPEVQFLRNALMRDQHVEFAAWLQHADPGFRQPGDRPIHAAAQRRRRAAAVRRPAAGRPGHAGPAAAMARHDHQVRRPGRRRPDLRRGRALFAAALRGGRRPRRPAADWTRILPVVREPGLFRTEAEVRLSTQTTYTLELTPEGRGDPIFEFNPDPIRNRAILTSLPGMYWSFPVTRARPGATVLARHGDPRMQNQYGRQVLLASQLYGPGRTVFIGFDSTYRWRYLSEDYFDGFWARLVDRVGPEQGAGRPVPVPGAPGQERLSRRRPGVDRRPLHRRRRRGRGRRAGGRARDRRPAARAAPVRARARRSRLADRHVPGRSRPARTRCGSSRRPRPTPGSGVRASTTNFRVEPPTTGDRRAVAEPAAPGRPRPAHRAAGSSSSRTSASSTTRSRCAR